MLPSATTPLQWLLPWCPLWLHLWQPQSHHQLHRQSHPQQAAQTIHCQEIGVPMESMAVTTMKIKVMGLGRAPIVPMQALEITAATVEVEIRATLLWLLPWLLQRL